MLLLNHVFLLNYTKHNHNPAFLLLTSNTGFGPQTAVSGFTPNMKTRWTNMFHEAECTVMCKYDIHLSEIPTLHRSFSLCSSAGHLGKK